MGHVVCLVMDWSLDVFGAIYFGGLGTILLKSQNGSAAAIGCGRTIIISHSRLYRRWL